MQIRIRIESELLTNEWRQLGDESQPPCRLFFFLSLDANTSSPPLELVAVGYYRLVGRAEGG